MPKTAAAERRIKLRSASEMERAAYKKFMEATGIPLLRADTESFYMTAKRATRNRHKVLLAAFDEAARLADLAERIQVTNHGAANTGGAALAATAIRAYSGLLKTSTEIDELFLTDWISMETAPMDGRAIIITADSGAVGEAKYEEGSGWFWAGCHSTDATDGKIYDPKFWMPMPARPESR